MFLKDFLQESQKAAEILSATEQNAITWRITTFSKDCDDWTLVFSAEHNGLALTLTRGHALTEGRNIMRESAKLIGEEGGKIVLDARYCESADYVETLSESGSLSVMRLAGMLIEKFRKERNFHWSIE